MRKLLENVSLGLFFASAVLKSNIISLVYTYCIFQYFISRNKTRAMIINTSIIGLSIIIAYLLALLNLNERNSPRDFPSDDYKYPEYLNGHFIFPIFVHIPFLNDNLMWTYYLAMGIDKLSTLTSLWVDFANLCVVTTYFLIYRNPVLRNKIKKISWNIEDSD
jgi:branched-subunit amino acid ABC-type transport system permease component